MKPQVLPSLQLARGRSPSVSYIDYRFSWRVWPHVSGQLDSVVIKETLRLEDALSSRNLCWPRNRKFKQYWARGIKHISESLTRQRKLRVDNTFKRFKSIIFKNLRYASTLNSMFKFLFSFDYEFIKSCLRSVSFV